MRHDTARCVRHDTQRNSLISRDNDDNGRSPAPPNIASVGLESAVRETWGCLRHDPAARPSNNTTECRQKNECNFDDTLIGIGLRSAKWRARRPIFPGVGADDSPICPCADGVRELRTSLNGPGCLPLRPSNNHPSQCNLLEAAVDPLWVHHCTLAAEQSACLQPPKATGRLLGCRPRSPTALAICRHLMQGRDCLHVPGNIQVLRTVLYSARRTYNPDCTILTLMATAPTWHLRHIIKYRTVRHFPRLSVPASSFVRCPLDRTM